MTTTYRWWGCLDPSTRRTTSGEEDGAHDEGYLEEGANPNDRQLFELQFAFAVTGSSSACVNDENTCPDDTSYRSPDKSAHHHASMDVDGDALSPLVSAFAMATSENGSDVLCGVGSDLHVLRGCASFDVGIPSFDGFPFRHSAHVAIDDSISTVAVALIPNSELVAVLSSDARLLIVHSALRRTLATIPLLDSPSSEHTLSALTVTVDVDEDTLIIWAVVGLHVFCVSLPQCSEICGSLENQDRVTEILSMASDKHSVYQLEMPFMASGLVAMPSGLSVQVFPAASDDAAFAVHTISLIDDIYGSCSERSLVMDVASGDDEGGDAEIGGWQRVRPVHHLTQWIAALCGSGRRLEFWNVFVAKFVGALELSQDDDDAALDFAVIPKQGERSVATPAKKRLRLNNAADDSSNKPTAIIALLRASGDHDAMVELLDLSSNLDLVWQSNTITMGRLATLTTVPTGEGWSRLLVVEPQLPGSMGACHVTMSSTKHLLPSSSPSIASEGPEDVGLRVRVLVATDPMVRLQRLVNRDELEAAEVFARQRGLDMQMVYVSQMWNLSRRVHQPLAVTTDPSQPSPMVAQLVDCFEKVEKLEEVVDAWTSAACTAHRRADLALLMVYCDQLVVRISRISNRRPEDAARFMNDIQPIVKPILLTFRIFNGDAESEVAIHFLAQLRAENYLESFLFLIQRGFIKESRIVWSTYYSVLHGGIVEFLESNLPLDSAADDAFDPCGQLLFNVESALKAFPDRIPDLLDLMEYDLLPAILFANFQFDRFKGLLETVARIGSTAALLLESNGQLDDALRATRILDNSLSNSGNFSSNEKGVLTLAVSTIWRSEGESLKRLRSLFAELKSIQMVEKSLGIRVPLSNWENEYVFASNTLESVVHQEVSKLGHEQTEPAEGASVVNVSAFRLAKVVSRLRELVLPLCVRFGLHPDALFWKITMSVLVTESSSTLGGGVSSAVRVQASVAMAQKLVTLVEAMMSRELSVRALSRLAGWLAQPWPAVLRDAIQRAQPVLKCMPEMRLELKRSERCGLLLETLANYGLGADDMTWALSGVTNRYVLVDAICASENIVQDRHQRIQDAAKALHLLSEINSDMTTESLEPAMEHLAFATSSLIASNLKKMEKRSEPVDPDQMISEMCDAVHGLLRSRPEAESRLAAEIFFAHLESQFYGEPLRDVQSGLLCSARVGVACSVVRRWLNDSSEFVSRMHRLERMSQLVTRFGLWPSSPEVRDPTALLQQAVRKYNVQECDTLARLLDLPLHVAKSTIARELCRTHQWNEFFHLLWENTHESNATIHLLLAKSLLECIQTTCELHLTSLVENNKNQHYPTSVHLTNARSSVQLLTAALPSIQDSLLIHNDELVLTAVSMTIYLSIVDGALVQMQAALGLSEASTGASAADKSGDGSTAVSPPKPVDDKLMKSTCHSALLGDCALTSGDVVSAMRKLVAPCATLGDLSQKLGSREEHRRVWEELFGWFRVWKQSTLELQTRSLASLLPLWGDAAVSPLLDPEGESAALAVARSALDRRAPLLPDLSTAQAVLTARPIDQAKRALKELHGWAARSSRPVHSLQLVVALATAACGSLLGSDAFFQKCEAIRLRAHWTARLAEEFGVTVASPAELAAGRPVTTAEALARAACPLHVVLDYFRSTGEKAIPLRLREWTAHLLCIVAGPTATAEYSHRLVPVLQSALDALNADAKEENWRMLELAIHFVLSPYNYEVLETVLQAMSRFATNEHQSTWCTVALGALKSLYSVLWRTSGVMESRPLSDVVERRWYGVRTRLANDYKVNDLWNATYTVADFTRHLNSTMQPAKLAESGEIEMDLPPAAAHCLPFQLIALPYVWVANEEAETRTCQLHAHVVTQYVQLHTVAYWKTTLDALSLRADGRRSAVLKYRQYAYAAITRHLAEVVYKTDASPDAPRHPTLPRRLLPNRLEPHVVELLASVMAELDNPHELLVRVLIDAEAIARPMHEVVGAVVPTSLRTSSTISASAASTELHNYLPNLFTYREMAILARIVWEASLALVTELPLYRNERPLTTDETIGLRHSMEESARTTREFSVRAIMEAWDLSSVLPPVCRTAKTALSHQLGDENDHELKRPMADADEAFQLARRIYEKFTDWNDDVDIRQKTRLVSAIYDVCSLEHDDLKTNVGEETTVFDPDEELEQFHKAALPMHRQLASLWLAACAENSDNDGQSNDGLLEKQRDLFDETLVGGADASTDLTVLSEPLPLADHRFVRLCHALRQLDEMEAIQMMMRFVENTSSTASYRMATTALCAIICVVRRVKDVLRQLAPDSVKQGIYHFVMELSGTIEAALYGAAGEQDDEDVTPEFVSRLLDSGNDKPYEKALLACQLAINNRFVANEMEGFADRLINRIAVSQPRALYHYLRYILTCSDRAPLLIRNYDRFYTQIVEWVLSSSDTAAERANVRLLRSRLIWLTTAAAPLTSATATSVHLFQFAKRSISSSSSTNMSSQCCPALVKAQAALDQLRC